MSTLVSTGQLTIVDQNDAYTLTIVGGTRAYIYNAAGNAASPSTSTTFSINLLKGSTSVTPSTYSWTTTGMLTTSGSTSTFTPTPAGSYSAATDTVVAVTVVHEGISISQTIPIAISKVGDTGATGLTGQSNHRIYIAGANSSSTPATPSTTVSGATPALWSSTPVTLTGTQAQFQSDGITPAGSSTTTWSTPYLSYFRVAALSAITADLGTITAGSIAVGSTPVISGTTMTGSGAVINNAGTFAVGDSTNNITYNGSEITFNGKIISPSAVKSGTFSGSGWSGSISIGGTIVPSFYAYTTASNTILPLAQISDDSTGSTKPALVVSSYGNTESLNVSNYSSSGGKVLKVAQYGSQDASYGLVVDTASDNPSGTNTISATGTSAIGLLVKSTGASSGAAKFVNTGATSNSNAVTFTASTNKVNATAHGYSNGGMIVFSGLTGGGGISTGTIYYIRNAAADDFEICASATGTAAVVDITSDGSGTAGIPRQFWAAPGGYAAYSPAGGGKYYFTDGIGPFTGYHNVLVPKSVSLNLGQCLVDTDAVFKLDINNVLFSAELSSDVEQAGVIGIVSAVGEINDLIILPEYLREQYKQTHWLVDINAVGEGQILVSGKAGNIQKGDLLASGMFGITQKQSSNQVFNYTVARSREAVVFNNENEVKLVACVYMCG